MTAEQTTSDTRRARPWFYYAWHPAAILLFLVIANIANGVQAQLISLSPRHDGDLLLGLIWIFLVTLILLGVEGFGSIIAIYRRDLTRAAWQALAVVLLVASIVLARQTVCAIQFTNLFLFPGTFAACEHNAQPYGSDAKFNLCSDVSSGDSLFFLIVYDSGGEIAQRQIDLPEPQPFREALKAQHDEALTDCRIGSVLPLYRAFYLLDSYCGQ